MHNAPAAHLCGRGELLSRDEVGLDGSPKSLQQRMDRSAKRARYSLHLDGRPVTASDANSPCIISCTGRPVLNNHDHSVSLESGVVSDPCRAYQLIVQEMVMEQAGRIDDSIKRLTLSLGLDSS